MGSLAERKIPTSSSPKMLTVISSFAQLQPEQSATSCNRCTNRHSAVGTLWNAQRQVLNRTRSMCDLLDLSHRNFSTPRLILDFTVPGLRSSICAISSIEYSYT